MTFLIIWAVMLVIFLTVASYRGYKNRLRVKNVSKKVNSLQVKVNQLWEKIK